MVRRGGLADPAGGLLAGRGGSRLCVTAEKVPGHAQLPVGGMDEGHLLFGQEQRQRGDELDPAARGLNGYWLAKRYGLREVPAFARTTQAGCQT